MKKICLLIAIGLILTYKLEAKKIKGKIIFNDDTLVVTFNIPTKSFGKEPNYERMQYRVKYYDASGKKMVLKPDQAKEIQFQYERNAVRMLSRYNLPAVGKNYAFLKLAIDGNLKLFNYYYTQNSPGMYNGSTGTMTGSYPYSVEKYLLQKGDGELKRPKGLTFRKDMVEYLSDCPSLMEKIESKDFREKDLELIVAFYNSNCRN